MFIGTFYFFFFRIANNGLHRNITWWIYRRLANEVFKAVFGLPTRHSERVFVALVLSLQGSVSIVTGSWYDWVYEELAYGSFEFHSSFRGNTGLLPQDK